MKMRSISKSLTGAAANKRDDPAQPQAEGNTRQMVIDATPQIIKALIEKAKDGSYLHARMLFEFAGLTGVSEPRERESPLVAILVKELGLSIAPGLEAHRNETGRLQSSIANEPPRDANKAT